MAEPQSIKIQIDEEALRQQVETSLQEATESAAMRLRSAADVLDGGRWITEFEKFQEQRMRDEYARGRADAVAEAKREGAGS